MEEKVARICWNSNMWIFPSGSEGKSKDESSFEVSEGYGHEEWLGDNSKLIDGYKFSFLQPVNTRNKSHQGREYSILLYTVFNKRKLCVGHIKHAICLTRDEAERVTNIYHENKWFDEMQIQLTENVEKPAKLISDEFLHNFNIKFKPSDIEWFENPEDISKIYNVYRYNLLNKENSQTTDQTRYKITPDELSSDFEKILDTGLSQSEMCQEIMARIGQGKFRRNVIKMWGGEEKCAISLIDVKEMLIASHIKSWKNCKTSEDRWDGANGILLCAHIDKLFDNHLITFKQKKIKYESKYVLQISKSLNRSIMKGLGVENGTELDTTKLSLHDLERLESNMYHHNEIFYIKENKLSD